MYGQFYAKPNYWLGQLNEEEIIDERLWKLGFNLWMNCRGSYVASSG